MTATGRFCALVLVLCGLAPLGVAAGGDYLLFAPHPVETLMVPKPGEGVLVERITVRRGDTLAKISRKHGRKGSYFPQILLFNAISNPDLIHPGQSLLVPVSASFAQSIQAAEKKKAPKSAGAKKKRRKVKSDSASAATRTEKPAAPPAVTTGVKEQGLYARAIGDYKKGEYRKALRSFSRFIEQYPNSPLAPDAALYKADSLLKLSGN